MRLLVILLMAIAASAGCRRTATETVAYKDEMPRPEEPLIRQLPAVGRHGGRFVLSETNNPRTFNGMMATETSSTDVTDRLFGFLVDFDNGTQQYGPGLAKSWEVAPDGVTWTFHLRRGARVFRRSPDHRSGRAVFALRSSTTRDCIRSIQDSLQVGGQNFTVTAPDAYTIVINTGKPHAGLLDALCPGNLPIIPKHVLEPAFRDGSFAAAYNVSTPPDKIVTSGAWRIAQYAANEKTVLVRNPYYYAFDQNNQRLPYLDELVYLVNPDQDAADLMFRSGGARRRRRCEAGKLQVVRGKPEREEISPCTISAPRRIPI